MGLNIVAQQGDFDPFVKYDAKAGRWFNKEQVEIANPTFVADMANIKTGWFYFPKGMAPEKVFDESLSKPAQRPEKTYTDDKGVTKNCFSRGFELRLFSKNSFGGVVVFSGTSMHLNAAISELYEAYEKGLEENKNKLPVVKCTGVDPMPGKYGTNYKPKFVIEKWVDRPAELDAVGQTAPAQVATKAAPVESVSEF